MEVNRFNRTVINILVSVGSLIAMVALYMQSTVIDRMSTRIDVLEQHRDEAFDTKERRDTLPLTDVKN